MSAATAQLESALAYLYRTHGEMQRIADGAGLDSSHLALQESAPVTAWHNIVVLAVQENRLAELYALARKEHPRNADLEAAWSTYPAAQTPAPAHRKRPPSGQAGQRMSDLYRIDARVDQLQRDLSDARAQVAGLGAQVTGISAQLTAQNSQIAALTAMVRDLADEHDTTAALSNKQFAGLLLFILLLGVLVFAIVYIGGAR